MSLYPPLAFGVVEEGLYRSSLPSALNFEVIVIITFLYLYIFNIFIFILKFLKTLKLKSFILLTPNSLDSELAEFLDKENISLYFMTRDEDHHPNFDQHYYAVDEQMATQVLQLLVSGSSNFQSFNSSLYQHGQSLLVHAKPGTIVSKLANKTISYNYTNQESESNDESIYPALISCRNGKTLTSLVVACLRKLQNWSLIATLEECRRSTSKLHQHHQQQLEQFVELFDVDLIDSMNLPHLHLLDRQNHHNLIHDQSKKNS